MLKQIRFTECHVTPWRNCRCRVGNEYRLSSSFCAVFVFYSVQQHHTFKFEGIRKESGMIFISGCLPTEVGDLCGRCGGRPRVLKMTLTLGTSMSLYLVK